MPGFSGTRIPMPTLTAASKSTIQVRASGTTSSPFSIRNCSPGPAAGSGPTISDGGICSPANSSTCFPALIPISTIRSGSRPALAGRVQADGLVSSSPSAGSSQKAIVTWACSGSTPSGRSSNACGGTAISVSALAAPIAVRSSAAKAPSGSPPARHTRSQYSARAVRSAALSPKAPATTRMTSSGPVLTGSADGSSGANPPMIQPARPLPHAPTRVRQAARRRPSSPPARKIDAQNLVALATSVSLSRSSNPSTAHWSG